jgi:formate-dependent nitrite reductase cytochrome c552 subunit
MCGNCHLDTHAEWEGSIHGQENLACVRCHNPHTTDLRADGVQTLCQSCHNEVAHFYSYTGHAEEGLLCSDCHLRVSDAAEGQMGEGHGQRVHSFTVDLESCSQCHEDEMHYPGEDAMTLEDDLGTAMEPALSMASVVPLNSEPDPVSPFGFAVLASLVGMGFGIVVAPWLEKWNRRVSNEGNKDE